MRPSLRLLLLLACLTAASIVLSVADTVGTQALLALWALLLIASIVDLFLTSRHRITLAQAALPKDGFVGHSAKLHLHFEAGTSPHPKTRFAITFFHATGLTVEPQRNLSFEEIRNIAIPIGLKRRGVWEVFATMLCYQSRMGLFDMLPRFAITQEIRVQPDVSRILNGEVEAQITALTSGARSFDHKGDGSEFHQLREYQPGMDPRKIDWKRSARRNELVARETRVERNQHIIIAFDTGRLMAEQLGQLEKLDHAITAGLSLVWAGQIAGDMVGAYHFASRPGLILPAASGQPGFARLRSMATDLHADQAETNHTLGLSYLRSKLTQRALVIVFSDFTDTITAELMVENLSVMAKTHLVVYVAMKDTAISALANQNAIDIATASQSVAAMQLEQERSQVIDTLKRMGILVIDTQPDMLSTRLISEYIKIKQRELL